MKKVDYHMHTKFSIDSEADPRLHILAAIDMGLSEICFTDHQDFDRNGPLLKIDIDAYYQGIKLLKEEFKDKIVIKWGIEVGLDLNYYNEINEFISKYPFDFVIGSMHTVKEVDDLYLGSYFKDKSKDEAYREFFEATLKCVNEFDCFNVLGHLDFIVRYGPYENKLVEHDKYQDIIDEIFKTLIRKNKGIEVNTSGYLVHGNCGFPNFEQVKRYYDLGGRIISVGSDAHDASRVGENIDNVIKKYQEIGFSKVSTFTRMKED